MDNKLKAEIERLKKESEINAEGFIRLQQCKKDIALFKELVENEFRQEVCEQTGECLEHKKMLLQQLDEALSK